MPLFFSFRHHIELNLKGLIVNFYEIKYKDTHSLLKLTNAFKEKLYGIEEDLDATRIYNKEAFIE